MNIVITGASAGIGAALAVAFGEGHRILLVGRDAPRLAGVAEAVRKAGSVPHIAVADVRNRQAMAFAIQAFDDAWPVDLLVANAGVSAGLSPDRRPEAEGVSARLSEINLGGMFNTVEPLLARLQDRRRGRIVLISSLAGLRPLPDMPTYSATKAAVAAYGVALRGWLRPFGVAITVVYPGFVTSAMSARHRGPRPLEISAEAAARIIVRGIARRRATIAFPRLLVIGILAGKLLPPALSDWFMKPFQAEVEPDDGR